MEIVLYLALGKEQQSDESLSIRMMILWEIALGPSGQMAEILWEQTLSQGKANVRYMSFKVITVELLLLFKSICEEPDPYMPKRRSL
jgi:hypothetical protein